VINKTTTPVINRKVQKSNPQELGLLWIAHCLVSEQTPIDAPKLLPDATADVGWELATNILQQGKEIRRPCDENSCSSRDDLIVVAPIARSIGQDAVLRDRSNGEEHGPQTHGHQLILGQTHRIALSRRMGQRFSSDDIEQTRFRLRYRRQITIGQVTAALAFEQTMSEPTQTTTAFRTRRS
jgi:hypothetical protein